MKMEPVLQENVYSIANSILLWPYRRISMPYGRQSVGAGVSPPKNSLPATDRRFSAEIKTIRGTYGVTGEDRVRNKTIRIKLQQLNYTW